MYTFANAQYISGQGGYLLIILFFFFFWTAYTYYLDMLKF